MIRNVEAKVFEMLVIFSKKNSLLNMSVGLKFDTVKTTIAIIDHKCIKIGSKCNKVPQVL